MTEHFDPKRLARLQRGYAELLAPHDAGPDVHPCDAPCPTKQGQPCGRWLGTKQLPDGSRRSVNHQGTKVPRVRNPRHVIRSLERLEPVLRGLLTWLDAHRTPAKAT